ncbi:MAG: glycosyltransferase family 2 protein [Patescibacteria group bacterium]
MTVEEKSYLRLARPFELKDKKERRIFRFYEMLPGLLAWGTLILFILSAKFFPEQTSFFLIIFVLFWFLRTIYFTFLLFSGFRKTKTNQKISWRKKIESLSFPRLTLPNLKSLNQLWQLVILPTYKEPYPVLRDSLEALKNSGYPVSQMIVVVGFEKREQKQAEPIAEKIRQEYQTIFGHFLITFHPDQPGELAGKGANEAYTGKQVLEKVINPAKIPLENIITTVLDADTQVDPGYFDCLSYHYLTCQKPLRSSFQPIPLYTNNIWQAPVFSRILAFSTTFWQMIQQARPEAMVTYSSQSIGFKPITEIGFWQENLISEDSRIFYQCFLHFDGDWQVVPLYFSVRMDANFGSSFWQTIKRLYVQQRRWAYGAENIPYLLYGYRKNKKISLKEKIKHAFIIIEGFHSWTTHSVILFFLGWLPLWLGSHNFKFTILSYNLPQIAGFFMRFSMIGLFLTAYFAMVLMPKKPGSISRAEKIWLFFQWLLGPVSIFLSTLPAIDAVTRLMLGKYMGFHVTLKSRNKT